MSLIALGINHKTAPVSIREKAAFADHELSQSMADLKQHIGDCEVAIISTCNRVECYVYSDSVSEEDLQSQASNWIEQTKQLQQPLNGFTYCHSGLDGIRHIMRVASGLDSMVLGEPQILGQLKACYQKAKRANSINQVMERLFQKAFSAAKKVRHETEIGTNPVSVAFAAVNLAKHIFTDFSQITVLFVGAGETIELAARHLAHQGVENMIMANRTLANGQILAEQFGGSAIGLEAIPHHFPKADIVISSTGSMLPIIGKGMVEQAIKARRRQCMFMVDLAVPRDIEASVADLDDVYLYTVDDLEDVIQGNMQARLDAASEAEEILIPFINDFEAWHAGRLKHDTVRELQKRFSSIAQQELERAKAQLQNSEQPESALEALSHRLLKKFLHQPLVWLRKEHDEFDTHLLTREMFGLNNDEDLSNQSNIEKADSEMSKESSENKKE